MNFDLRLPIGLMFSLFGALLSAYGVLTSSSKIYDRSLGININLWWGLALLVFGGAMLLMVWRASKKPKI
jgi:hypothetical protein